MKYLTRRRLFTVWASSVVVILFGLLSYPFSSVSNVRVLSEVNLFRDDEAGVIWMQEDRELFALYRIVRRIDLSTDSNLEAPRSIPRTIRRHLLDDFSFGVQTIALKRGAVFDCYALMSPIAGDLYVRRYSLLSRTKNIGSLDSLLIDARPLLLGRVPIFLGVLVLSIFTISSHALLFIRWERVGEPLAASLGDDQ